MKNISDRPQVSVIVPVYNVEKFLQRCLDSISNQDFNNFECICIDDGSTDGSGKILDEYAKKDSRFIVIHKKNGGVSAARNEGLNCAKGEYVSFVDSDDWIERETYSKAYAVAKKNNLDIVRWTFQRKNARRPDLKEGFFSIEKNCKYFSASCWDKLIRTDLIKRNRIKFPVGFRLSEDRLFCFKCFLCSKRSYFINEPFYHYEIIGTSVTHLPTESMILEEVKIVQKMEMLVKWNAGLYKNLISRQKCMIISNTLGILSRSAIKLSRTIFPGENLKFILQMKKKSLVFLLICLHFDSLAFLIIKVWKKMGAKNLI